MSLLFVSVILSAGILLLLECSEASLAVRMVKHGHLKLHTLTSSGKEDGFANQLFGIIYECLSLSTAWLRSSMKECGFSGD